MRVFTTSFLFNNESHNAIVIMKTQEEKLSFSISVLNEDSNEWVAGGHIKLQSEIGLEKIEVLSDHLSNPIIESVKASIEAHMVNS